MLADLRTAVKVVPAATAVGDVLRWLQLQAYHLRPPGPANRPGYAAAHLALEALRDGAIDFAEDAASWIEGCPAPQLIPAFTTEDASPYSIGTLGRHAGPVWALAVTKDGRVVSGGGDYAVRLWNPADPNDPGREIGRHQPGWLSSSTFAITGVLAVAVTAHGQVVSGGDDGLWQWDPNASVDPGRQLGPRNDDVPVTALAVRKDGAVFYLSNGIVRLWLPTEPDEPGRELRRSGHGTTPQIWALAVTDDGQAISGNDVGVVWLWNPADPDDPGRELGRHTDQVNAGRLPSTAASSPAATTGWCGCGTRPTPMIPGVNSAATPTR